VKIEDAIRQPVIEDPGNKAGINILYTASWLSTVLARQLKPYGISWQQFNIMRILRGQKGVPAPLMLVTERMIDQMSNTSRLIDKLVTKGLVERRECPKDRRKVDLLLTSKGTDVVERARESVEENMRILFRHMSDQQLEQLSTLLDEFRN
jgi:DNA-binding MarR family transcriptional regulator